MPHWRCAQRLWIRFDVERFDGQSAFADRRGGLRRSSLQAAAGVGARGACDRETRQSAPFAAEGDVGFDRH